MAGQGEHAVGVAPLTSNDTYASPINDAFTAPTTSTLSTGTPSVAPGTPISFRYSTSASSSSSTNWIGLYPIGVTPGSQSSIMWQYATGTSGSRTFATTSLAAGNYAAWYLYNDGYTVLAGPTDFTVMESEHQHFGLPHRQVATARDRHRLGGGFRDD